MKDPDPRDEPCQRARDRASGHQTGVPVDRDEPAIEPAVTPPEPPAAGADDADELLALEHTIARDERRTVELQNRLAKVLRERSELEAEVEAAREEHGSVTGRLEELLERLSRFPDRGDGDRR